MAGIKTWSDETKTGSPMKNPEARACFIENHARLGLNPETNSMFHRLETDDAQAFIAHFFSAAVGFYPMASGRFSSDSLGHEE